MASASPPQGKSLADHQHQLRELGSSLQQARQARGLSLEALAERLRLGSEQLRALEEGDWEHLPEPVFVIAQLRRVAGALGLDLGDRLAALRNQPNRAAHPTSTVAPLLLLPEPSASGGGAHSPRPSSRHRRGQPARLTLWLALSLAAASALALAIGLARRPQRPAADGATSLKMPPSSASLPPAALAPFLQANSTNTSLPPAPAQQPLRHPI